MALDLQSLSYKKLTKKCNDSISVLTSGYSFIHLDKIVLCFFLLFLSSACSSKTRVSPTSQNSNDIELGEEYTEYRRDKIPSGHPPDEKPLYIYRVASYFTDRVLDFTDIFKIDVGVGPSWGAVIRLTRYGQAGIRTFSPASLRVGLRGRRSPVVLERVNEFGIGPGFMDSDQREVSVLEIGAGADIFVIGAYAGVSIDGLFDFILGFIGIDISDDDGALYRVF